MTDSEEVAFPCEDELGALAAAIAISTRTPDERLSDLSSIECDELDDWLDLLKFAGLTHLSIGDMFELGDVITRSRVLCGFGELPPPAVQAACERLSLKLRNESGSEIVDEHARKIDDAFSGTEFES